MVGKRELAGSVSSAAGPSRLPTVVCESSGIEFLVDSGAAVSVLPKSYLQSSPELKTHVPVVAITATGRPIETCGSRMLTFNVIGEKFVHKFIVANVDLPILGWDFVSTYGLQIHPASPYLRRPVPSEGPSR